MNFDQLKKVLSPYYDIIIFVVTLFVANFVWKASVSGDEQDVFVSVFGMDATPFFNAIASNVAAAVYWCVSLFRDTIHLVGNTLRFDNGYGSRIVWSCTPIKQSFIWLCLILTVRGGWLHKTWFIPFGWVIVYLFNILRISIITLFVEFHPDWFVPLHDYLFKYLFYGVMFLLWVWFVEGIRKPLSKTATLPSDSVAL